MDKAQHSYTSVTEFLDDEEFAGNAGHIANPSGVMQCTERFSLLLRCS